MLSAALAANAGSDAVLPASVQDPGASGTSLPAQANLTAIDVFALADEARLRKDYTTAETAFVALIADPDIEVRTEARFRLAMMLSDDMGRHAEAATLLRRILDDKPGAGRVRLELARMQTLIGNVAAARRELRAAQASGLPASVEQIVRFYSQALNARKPLGGSIELAIAPDSNINRATRSDTIGTVIGDFSLTADARAQSGVGLDLQLQGYARLPVGSGTDWMVRASGDARVYRQRTFNDIAFSLQTGPQITWGSSQITISAGPSFRWFGPTLFSSAIGGGIGVQKPVGRRGQVRAEGNVASVNNKRNSLQSATSLAFSAGFDRAFTARAGGGIQIALQREAARDPGFALTSGGLSGYVFQEVGRTTLVATLGYGHLEADQRLFLYPRRRVEDRYNASVAATLRALSVGSLAPLVRLRWERNRSTIEIYDYRRVVAEFGITSAF